MKSLWNGLIITLFLSISVSPVAARDLYVSPTGNDTASGDIATPLKSLQGARDRIRTLGIAGQEPIKIFFRQGTYVMHSPVEFGPQDSGSAANPITYSGYQNEQVVLNGGQVLTGWHTATVNGKSVWQTTIPAGLPIPRQLWVNNLRATRARTDTPITDWVKVDTGFTVPGTFTVARPGDLEVVSRGSSSWHELRCGVASRSGNGMVMDAPCWYNIGKFVSEMWPMDKPEWIENAQEFIDRPGEWYVNPQTRVISYLPRSGEQLATVQTTIPVSEGLIRLVGTSSDPVRFITFQQLTFMYATWNDPEKGPSTGWGFVEVVANRLTGTTLYPPPAYKYPVAAITLSHAQNISFNEIRITRNGGSGIVFIEGVKNTNVTASKFSDLSSSGIVISLSGGPSGSNPPEPDQNSDNIINQNYITNIGAEYHGAVGIYGTWQKNTRIRHNTLSNLPYSAITLGLTGSDPTYARDNEIDANLIVDHMRTLFDGGGLYIIASQPGTVFSNNVILRQAHTPGNIYPDAGSRLITFRQNVVFSQSTGVKTVHENGGGNTFTNNYWLGDETDTSMFLFNNVRFKDLCKENGVTIPGGCPDSIRTNNHTITSLSQVPQTILSDAGVSCGYRDSALETALKLPYTRSCTGTSPTVTPTPTKRASTPTPTVIPAKPGDLDHDGDVDIFDYHTLVTDFGKTGVAGWIPSDIVKNGAVDIFDYNILVGAFGT